MEEEFDEEEVWAMMRETKDDTLKTIKLKDASFFTSRKIPRSNIAVGEDNSSAEVIQQSAPVTIPIWSKMFEKGDEEDEGENRVPPHEWIAKKMEKNQISSFSVCEGEGRTLKGRDQRKLRNAVLSRTGFLE